MKGGCSHAGETIGLKADALAHALGEAEQRCVDSEERLTGPRRRVLELLLAADGPVKAYDLMAGYGEGGEAAKPPTVYRALEFLERLGFAHRLESLNAYVACRRAGDKHSAAFLICECCGATQELAADLTAEVERAGASRGYDVRGVTLEARGLCPACR